MIGRAFAAALTLGRFPPCLIEFLDLVETSRHGLGRLMIEGYHRLRQVVEERLQMLVKQRQPMLEAGVALPRTDRLVQRIVLHRAEQFAIAGAEPGDRCLIERHFADRLETEAIQPLGADLGHGIKAADRLQRVAEQVEAQRLGCPGRKQINNAAAQGVFARLTHRIGPAVAVTPEEGQKVVCRQRLAHRSGEGRTGKDGARRHSLQHGVDRGQNHPPRAFTGRQIGQRVDPPANHLAVGRDPVVGQAIPGRDGQYRQRRVEEHQRLCNGRHARVVARHVQHIPALPRHGGQDPRVHSGWRASDRGFASRTQDTINNCQWLKVSS